MWDVENSDAKTDETTKYSFECKVDALSPVHAGGSALRALIYRRFLVLQYMSRSQRRVSCLTPIDLTAKVR